MTMKLVLSIIYIALAFWAPSLSAQTPADQQRIIEPIIVNGQQAQGVLVLQNGAVQSYACSSPQPYTTANQSESGWACFDQATGMWLLHAQPPLQATAPQQQPTIVYSQPNPVYVPAPVYDYGYYPYPYYPYPYSYYSYPYFVGPRFGFGFGFGFRSPVIVVNRPFVIGRPFVGSRPFGGGFGRPGGGFGRAGGGFGRVGRR
jgi:hypothetical protein